MRHLIRKGLKFLIFLTLVYGLIHILQFSSVEDLPQNDEEEEDSVEVVFGTLHTLQNLSRWASLEENIFQELTQRLKLLEIEAHLIKQYLQSYEKTTRKAMENVHGSKSTPMERGEVVGSSGVLGHQMVTRYTSVMNRLREFRSSADYVNIQEGVKDVLQLNRPNWKNITQESKIDNSENNTDNMISQPNSSLIWPGWEDNYMSKLAFHHIQNEYEYKPKDLRVGLTFDTSFGGSLTARQCAEIGMFALARNYINMAIEWLELAKVVAAEEDNDQTISGEVVSSMLKISIQQNNRALQYAKVWQVDDEDPDNYHLQVEDLFTEPVQNSKNDSASRTKGREIIYRLGKTRKRTYFVDFSQYIDLCQGKTLQTPKVQSKLKCYYEQKRHPYLYINPVKVEQLSDSPPILQFYEMLGPNETERIKILGRAGMTMSGIQVSGGIEEDTKLRTSVGSFIDDEDLPNRLKFAEIVSGLALLEEDASEVTQFAEYTYGRFYTYHLDLLFSTSLETVQRKGNRIATMLYYLELPQEGGLTPFCEAGVSAHQVRGSAILWYNMYRNGTFRNDVTHGACPVVHGHKIIMTHWIRYGGNLHNYKCSLNQDE